MVWVTASLTATFLTHKDSLYFNLICFFLLLLLFNTSNVCIIFLLIYNASEMLYK